MGDSKTPEELKELGNKAFAAKKFQEAIDHYSAAIVLEKSNHVFFSNRSASFVGLEQWDKAAEDAKECIRLSPEFIKGYYRLAAAQIGLKEFDAAQATIRQGLGIEANNTQLLKQMRAVKQAQKIHESKQDAAIRGSGTRNMDESTRKELQDLQQQFTQTNRELQTVQANLNKTERESKSCELTKSELLPLDSQTKCFRSVGKMFLMSSKDDVVTYLDDQISSCSKQKSDMNQKLDYLQRRLKSQRQNIGELVGQS